MWENLNFWIFPQCLSFNLLFGIVWCWRSISCFRLLASLPYMSIRARVVIAVALHEIDHAPNAKSGSKCYNKGLQNVYCAIEKCHEYILSAASAAVRQADKRRSAFGRRRNQVGEIKSPLSHHQYVPFGIRRFNLTSRHDAHCNSPNNLPVLLW